jgi:hypothetical protein
MSFIHVCLNSETAGDTGEVRVLPNQVQGTEGDGGLRDETAEQECVQKSIQDKGLALALQF